MNRKQVNHSIDIAPSRLDEDKKNETTAKAFVLWQSSRHVKIRDVDTVASSSQQQRHREKTERQ